MDVPWNTRVSARRFGCSLNVCELTGRFVLHPLPDESRAVGVGAPLKKHAMTVSSPLSPLAFVDAPVCVRHLTDAMRDAVLYLSRVGIAPSL